MIDFEQFTVSIDSLHDEIDLECPGCGVITYWSFDDTPSMLDFMVAVQDHNNAAHGDGKTYWED